MKTLIFATLLLIATSSQAALGPIGVAEDVNKLTKLSPKVAMEETDTRLIQFNKDIKLKVLHAKFQGDFVADGTEIEIEKDTVLTFYSATNDTVKFGLETDEQSPEIPYEIIISKEELSRAQYEILDDLAFDDSIDPDDEDAIASLEELSDSEFVESLVAGKSQLKKRKSSRLGAVCKMKRSRQGKLYKQCYCYRFVKAEMSKRGVSLSGGHARNAYSQMANKPGWRRTSIGSTRIGDICVWGGKGSGHVAVRKSCGWYWGNCTGLSTRPLLGCFTNR